MRWRRGWSHSGVRWWSYRCVRSRSGVAGAGFRTGGTRTRGARRLDAGKRVIARKRRGVGSRDDFCARGARRLHARKRMITVNDRGIACTRRRSHGAADATDVMASWRDRGNRRTRMRGDDAGTAQLRRVCGCRNGGMASIVVERQRRIFSSRLHVLRLLRRRRHTLLVGGSNLLRRRVRRRAAGAAVVAHVGRVVDDDGLVVDVGDRRVGDVVNGAVVEEIAAVPIAALVAGAGIAEAIRHAPIEADLWAPITFVKGVDAVVPTPIAGRPQQPPLRRQYPRPRHPVIAGGVIPGPIAGRPHIAGRRYRRLIVDRQWRRRDIDSYAEAVLSISRRGRTILRRNSEPGSVGLRLITSVLVITVTTRPRRPLSTDGGTSSTADDRTNGRSAAAAQYPTNNGARGAAHYRTTNRILCSRLLHRHRKGNSQKGGNSDRSNHPDHPIVEFFPWTCGKTEAGDTGALVHAAILKRRTA